MHMKKKKKKKVTLMKCLLRNGALYSSLPVGVRENTDKSTENIFQLHAYIYYVCVCDCMHAYIHTYIYVCVIACMHTYIHTYIHTCMHTYMCVSLHACVCVCVCVKHYFSFDLSHLMHCVTLWNPTPNVC